MGRGTRKRNFASSKSSTAGEARSQIEKALQDEVEADWSEGDVEDLVEEELDEWEVDEES
jgi:hypothetical protein